MPKLILASSSPRRKEILTMLGIPFEIMPADIDESVQPGENPTDYVERLAVEKALKVSLQFPDAYVIGSDLSIDVDGVAMGKAPDRAVASEMLHKLSGRSHFGRASFAILQGKTILARGVSTTTISFNELQETEIETYLDSKEWLGLAGAYGVQGSASKFVTKFIGSYFDILGLPIYHLGSALSSLGFELEPNWYGKIYAADLEKLQRFSH
jgi:septum formation protein